MMKVQTNYERLPDGTRPSISVEAHEDHDGYLSLEIPVDPRYLYGVSSRRVSANSARVDEIADAFEAAPGRMAAADARALLEEIRALRSELADVAGEVTAHLDAREAREVAAALVHVAAEIESGRA